MKEYITLILAVYVIVFICIRIYNNPRVEYFNEEENNSNGNNSNSNNDTDEAIDKANDRFKQQEVKQNEQNLQISKLKSRIDELRKSLVILNTKDENEYKNNYNKYNASDSLSQIPESIKNRMALPSNIDVNVSVDPTL